MKNREKYREEILSWVKNSDPYNDPYCEFAKKNIIPSFTGCTNGGCGGVTCTWCRAIFALWLDEEYIEPPKPEVDWDNVPVDTLVRVRDNDSGKWTLRYFRSFGKIYSSYPPGYDYEVWISGATSVTAEGCTERWKYCELVEVEDNEE